MKQVSVTTTDNPYSPFTQFESWLMFDIQKGYNTIERLGRFCIDSSALTDEEEMEELENSIDELIKVGFAMDKEGNVVEFKKVYYEND